MNTATENSEIHDRREKLIQFLDTELFDPILERVRDDYPTYEDKLRLEAVQPRVWRLKNEFRQEADVAENILERFNQVLRNPRVRRLESELRQLRLPFFSHPEVMNGFFDLAKKMGVGRFADRPPLAGMDSANWNEGRT